MYVNKTGLMWPCMGEWQNPPITAAVPVISFATPSSYKCSYDITADHCRSLLHACEPSPPPESRRRTQSIPSFPENRQLLHSSSSHHRLISCHINADIYAGYQQIKRVYGEEIDKRIVSNNRRMFAKRISLSVARFFQFAFRSWQIGPDNVPFQTKLLNCIVLVQGNCNNEWFVVFYVFFYQEIYAIKICN